MKFQNGQINQTKVSFVDKSNITGLKKDYEVDVLSVSPSPEQIGELWVV